MPISYEHSLNSGIFAPMETTIRPINKVLVANRGEIAIRVLRACVELDIRTIAIYTFEDRYSLHRYKADEAYQVGADDEPLKPYLDIEEIVNLAKEKGVDAIHPGYGFLSENNHFARRCAEEGIIFIGPRPDVMEALGDKVSAKLVAAQNNIPLIESNKEALTDLSIALSEANRIGFPLMVKAASGGGGRGMRVVRTVEELEKAYPEARREALNAFGDDTVFIEKFVESPKHIEVQIAGDAYGEIIHLHERDCSVQRRFQKVVEIAPAPNLPLEVKKKLHEYALTIGRAVKYNNLGTVEFLVDKAHNIYFIEVNPRIQVEHTVTEMVTNIDLVKTQIRLAEGRHLFEDEIIGIPSQEDVKTYGYAIQCRITTEDPQNDFKPDYGTILAYRSASGFGIRLDGGSVYQGVKISPFFDSLLVKVSAHSRTMEGAARKMSRTLKEFRVRGVRTNIPFLENIINNQEFISGTATVSFITDHPELFKFKKGQDRATKILRYLGEVTVNGHPDVKFKDPNKRLEKPVVPPYKHFEPYTDGTKQLLEKLGPDDFAKWLYNEKKIHFTDTTLRDAHQSLFATRMRSYDMLKVAESYAKNHPEIFSMEVWGGATFDVCLRFLYEDPWDRLRQLRKAVPNILLQMLIRGSNGVGYAAYPDNLIERFVQESWQNGIDVFRIFDSLNYMPGLVPAIEQVRKNTKGIAEAAVCYTGDILDPKKTKYNLKYYVQFAKDLENAGAHILCIKDMAGLLKPYAAKELVSALKAEIKIPIHLHTHDTSSLQPATYLLAAEAGVDVVDVALSSMSGTTSQPNFNSVVEMFKFNERENKDINLDSLNKFSNYFETVREYYYPFETDMKTGTAEVFNNEIPGGQYSNLRSQAIALGLGDKFHGIKDMYAEVNQLFGDVIKVTPSSKVVGDMAQFMIANGLTAADIMERGDQISFPESVQQFFMGEIGQPTGGFPKELQHIILKDKQPFNTPPGKLLAPIDFDTDFEAFKKRFEKTQAFTDYLSWKFFPKVFEEYYEKLDKFGDVSKIPTKQFFFGLENREETIIEIGPGQAIVVKLLGVGPAEEGGLRTVFYNLNGQTRNIKITDRSLNVVKIENRKADAADATQVAAPLQGMLSKVFVKEGQKVKRNEPLFVIEAMKMETTVTAHADLTVKSVILKDKTLVNGGDLVVIVAE